MLKFLGNTGLLEALLSSMQDGFNLLDAEGRHIFENEAMRRISGFSKEDLLGTTAPFPYWPPEELESITSAFRETLSGHPVTYELVFRRKDESRFWVSVSPAQIRDENGVLIGYFATIKDISERKRLEMALQESEQRWRSIAENPFDFVVVLDKDYRYTYVNHAAPGIHPDSLIGKATPFEFTDPIYHEIMRKSFQTTFETGKATSYDVYVPQLDAWYSSIVGPIKEGGQVTSISVLTREITLQKRTEEALRRSEHQLRETHKMQSIGTLAGGIAHDLNNLLTPILSYTELMQLSLPMNDPNQEFVEGIRAAGFRARDLVQRILLFSRRREAKKEQVDFGKLVREGIQLIKASTPSHIPILLELPQEPIFVFADPNQLHQVLTNVATNGIQSMQDSGGSLTVTIIQGLPDSMDGQAPANEKSKAEFVRLIIRDTGSGMDEISQRRAFEPFYTTKEIGSGTGLGLSIVHGIVFDHGGNITLKSKIGAGTSFTISLPISNSNIPVNQKKPVSEPVLSGSIRILCVDDELSVLDVIKQSLELAGHSVTIKSDPIEASELFKSDANSFDVLITDQTMPRLSGIALVKRVKAIRPDLPCILMTGLGDLQFERISRDAGVSELLAKPFLPSELGICLKRAISATRSMDSRLA